MEKDDGFGRQLEDVYSRLVGIARPGYAAVSGDSSTTTIEVNGKTYRIDGFLAQGDISAVYSGYMLDDSKRVDIVIKIIDEPIDNDLAQNEARILQEFWREPAAQHKHLPTLVDRFLTQGGRQALVLSRFDGYDLNFIRDEAFPQGVPLRHAGWVLARALSVAGFAHSKGIVHGNIEPAHLLVRPRDHNVCLVDWSYAILKPVETGEGFKAVNDEFSAPEVAEKGAPTPAADLYSLGKCLVYLLGGNTATDELPEEVDERFARFLRFMTLKSAGGRAQDAWELYRQLAELRREIHGKLKFETFGI